MVIATDHDLRARILGAAAREPSPTRGERRRRDAVLLVAGTAVAVAVFLLWGGVRPYARPPSLLLATATGSAVLAALALTVALRPGGPMLGAPRPPAGGPH